MPNITNLRLLDYFKLYSRKTKLKQEYLGNRCYCDRYNQQNSGFTLIELIVVVLMIGILAAIAAPSWAGFINRQRINKINDAVLIALQNGQREAKNKKLSYSVSFKKNSTTQNLEVFIYPTKKPDGTILTFLQIPDSDWKSLGADVGVSSDTFLLGANLSSENTVNSTDSTVSYTLTTPTKITFDYMGTLTPTPNFGTAIAPSTEPPGLKIAIALPSAANSTSPSTVKRCVIVKTLLGSMLTAKDDKCN